MRQKQLISNNSNNRESTGYPRPVEKIFIFMEGNL